MRRGTACFPGSSSKPHALLTCDNPKSPSIGQDMKRCDDAMWCENALYLQQRWNIMRCCAIPSDSVRYDAIQCDIMLYNTVRCFTVTIRVPEPVVIPTTSRSNCSIQHRIVSYISTVQRCTNSASKRKSAQCSSTRYATTNIHTMT